MNKNPYEILGLEQGASKDDVKRAYRKKARENHPDLNPGDKDASKRMNEINEAYDRIMNPDKYTAEDARKAAARGERPNNGYSYGGAGQGGQGTGQSSHGPFGPFGTGGQNTGGPGGAGQDGRYGWAGDFGFGFEDLFGGMYNAGPIHPEANPTDSPEIQQAINLINSNKNKEASKILYKVKSSDRDARWYYIIALANQGMNNTMLAIDQIKRACEMDPNNSDYKRAANSIQASGRTYQQTSSQRGFSTGMFDPMTMLCMCMLCMSCSGGFGFCKPF